MVIADGPMWTDVVQAVGTAVGALAVGVAGLALRHDMNARREEHRDAERAQALLVTCRFMPGVARDTKGSYIGVTVANDSPWPVRRLGVAVAARAKPAEREWLREHDYLGPDNALSAAWRSAPTEVYEAPPAGLDAWMLITQLTDASGLVWERVDNGEPQRITRGVRRRPLLHRLGAWLQRR